MEVGDVAVQVWEVVVWEAAWEVAVAPAEVVDPHKWVLQEWVLQWVSPLPPLATG